MDQEERRRMIEELAYYRSCHKSGSADPMENWLEAEKEVDRRLAEQRLGKKKEELDAFDRLQQEMSEILAGIKGSLPAETLRQALDKAVNEVKAMGKYSAESVNSAAEALKKEMARHIEKLRGPWRAVSLKTAGLFSVWSRRGIKFLQQAEEASEAWLKQTHEQVKSNIYHSDDIAPAGTFVCEACRRPLELEQTGHLPRCPQCDNTVFKLES
jgi:hypothetical protein